MSLSRTPLKVWPATLNEFIDQYDSYVTSWVLNFGLRGVEAEDAKQEVYFFFLRKNVVEKFDPTIPKFTDFLGYIHIKVYRILCSRYRREKRRFLLFKSITCIKDGEEFEMDMPDCHYIRRDELGRWWEDHQSLLNDPSIKDPVVLKRIGNKVYAITPLLVLNMVLSGFSAEAVIRTLRISRVCFNKVRTQIQEKLGSAILWADGGV